MKKWFNGLKVSQKLMLISIFFIMPDSLMLYLFITGINENIRFARMEKKGNEYQRPLEALLDLIPQHRSLAQRVLEGGPVQELVGKKQAQIDAAFDALQAVDARIGADLQFTQEGLAKRKREHYRVRTVRQEWHDLKTGLLHLKPEMCLARHRHLMADVRTMITHAGDLSNLILDPDLDSYYLMDVTLLALPQTQDRLAAVMAGGEAVIKRQTISIGERQQLAIRATLLQEADLDRISGSLQTALNEDANFYGSSATLQANVPAALQEYTNAAEVFISLTTRLVNSETVDVTAEEYSTAGSKAREASFILWRMADEELDKLLQKRIDAYRNSRARSLVVAAFALLAAIGFVSFITRSISGPLRKQAADLKIANESLQAEIIERKRIDVQLKDSFKEIVDLKTALDEHALVSITDPQGKITYANDKSCAISRYSREELLGQDHRIVNSNFHPKEFMRDLWTTLAHGKVWKGEIRNKAKDGSFYWVDATIFPFLNEQGKPRQYAVISTDITERKHAAEKLLEVSRQAGMAEVATEVLHNVGNVLNSVNVASACMTDRLKKSQSAGLSKVVTLLNEHATDLGMFLTSDPKGKQIPNYLAQLAGHLASEQAVALRELGHLQKNIDHIKDIVAMQQSYAKVAGVVESLQLADLVEDALRMNSSSLARHDLQVIREFQNVPPIVVEKHKVLQILVNLVQNAKHACDDLGHPEKRLTLRVSNGDDRVRVAVSDNGIGIPAENLTRIFSHGFTTKKDGHGFGLHSGALAAKELGGVLLAHSDGPGKGATFTLELPAHPKD